MLKLITLTAASIFTAEALVMLYLESFGSQLSFWSRTFLDASLLLVCVFPTLYFLVFKEMSEQISLRHHAEETQNSWNQSLELMVQERTERLQRANEELLVEVQERARTAMALRTALNETRDSKKQFQEIINAVQDSLVVVDAQWRVKIVNQAAETMFRSGSYDLIGQSLKEFLLPWSQSPADLNAFFDKNRNSHSTFLTPPGVHGERTPPVQMRFGAELEWEKQPSTVLTFYYREDLHIKESQLIPSNG